MYFVTELIDGISLAELLERQPGGRPLQPNEALGLSTDRRRPRLRPQARGDPPRRQARQRDGQDDRHAAHGVLVDFGITKMDDGETGPQGMFLGRRTTRCPSRSPAPRRWIAGPTSTRSRARRSRSSPGGHRSVTPRTTGAHRRSSAEPGAERRPFCPELPTAFDAVFAKALAKNREDRYGQLRRLRARAARRLPEGTHLRRPPPPGADLPAPSLYTPDMAPRRKWPWVSLGVLFAVLLTGWPTSSHRAAIRGSPTSVALR